MAFSHAERLQRAYEIAEKFFNHYGPEATGAAIYGSLARGTDGPYSDIEMFVIVDGEGIDRTFEWSAGPWKAEVDVYSADELLNDAREFDEFWPITHGAYIHLQPIRDLRGVFPQASAAARDHSEDEFRKLIAEVIVGDLFEAVGKLRNGLAQKRNELIAPFALDAARYGACLIGLHQRRVYTSGGSIFSESLELPDRPAGYDALARQVMDGDLSNAEEIVGLANTFWAGVEDWAAAQGIPLVRDLDEMLDWPA